MIPISSLLQNPFEMITSPSSSSSFVNLLRLHQQEVRFHAMKAAEVEESSNKQGNGPFLEERVHSRPINRPSSPAFMSPNASRLYSVAVTNGTNSTTSLSPETVFLSSIPVNGPSREDAIAASSAFRLNMDLHSSNSSHQLVGFCFLPPPELADMNYTAKGIPDLNLPPPDVSASELVLIIKNRNIFHFINAVCSLVVKQEGLEGLEEYMKNKSSLTELQLCNLYSIRIWNMLSLSRGGEIEKELVEEGLIEALIRVEDLPSPLELVLAPPDPYKASANQDARIDYKYKQASTWFDDNKETLSSDARNYDVVDDEEEDQGSGNYDVDDEEEEDESSGDEADHHLQRKKARHGGALRIDEPANP
ncbi:unnamed protein product [Prunus armeniaca]|uniref:Uncharacterized protein n=1 Tax=Prunus armeniaca TaxID=36596 RepID=A0A6J5WJM5_PRUAR|nr:unnamed protein product [Prunus armeniaca]